MLLLDGVRNERHGDGYTIGMAPTTGKTAAGTELYEKSLTFAADSVGSVFRAIEREFPKAKGSKSSSDTGRSGNFHHFTTFEQAKEVYTTRPYEVRTFSEKDEIVRELPASGNEVQFDVTGDFLDLGRYLEGAPECFGSMVYGVPKGFVTFMMNLTATHYVDHAAISQTGRRILRLVDWLENNGIRTRIVGFLMTQIVHVEIDIKAYESHLDMNDLAVAVHSDFFRRMLFRVIEYSDSHAENYFNPYGTAFCAANGNLSVNNIAQHVEDDLVIYTENAAKVEYVNTMYDKLEQELQPYIEAGTRRGFLAVVPEGR